MTEEQLTKILLDWLESNGWKIICYDFPQSGTGYSLHPNKDIRTTKNKGAIIPDIVAIKGSIAVFFENKDRFVASDFDKVNDLKTTSDYNESIEKLLINSGINEIFYGVGLPDTTNVKKSIAKHIEKIDFAVLVGIDKSVSVHYSQSPIF